MVRTRKPLYTNKTYIMSMKLESNIDDMVKRKVRGANTSGRVNVPKTWLDKYVVVCLLDEEQQKKAMEMDGDTNDNRSKDTNNSA